MATDMCSTPFGITDYIGAGRRVSAGFLVLNAFRHHGLYRVASTAAHRPLMCSTPFGITDYIGCSDPCRSAHACTGAQRLSASRIISDPGQHRQPRRRVLNAFRHHGLYRPGGCQHRVRRLCPVLNAFRHHGLYRKPGRREKVWRYVLCSTPFGITDYIGLPGAISLFPEDLSAQRLSASRIISDVASVPHGLHAPEVLNAFRHHGLYRMGRRYCHRGRDRLVLNAFRHHGLYRTPAIDPLRIRPSKNPPRVLNAFRHHGLYRLIEQVRAPQAFLRCSTPFGITDYIGVIASIRSADSRTSAQRLSASRIISGWRPRRLRRRPVLNAFRHHGLYRSARRAHRCPVVCSTPFGITDYIGSRRAPRGDTTTTGAQRLSASRIISVALAERAVINPHLCSTPFGITDYIGRDLELVAGERGEIVLNAFRHHGLYRQRPGARSRRAR